MTDKNGNELCVGDKVLAFDSQTSIEFRGVVEVFNGNRAEVSNEDYEIFTLNSDDLEILWMPRN